MPQKESLNVESTVDIFALYALEVIFFWQFGLKFKSQTSQNKV